MEKTPTDPIRDDKIYKQPVRATIFATKRREKKDIRVYQVHHLLRRQSSETATSPKVNLPSSRNTCTNEEKYINYTESSVVQWESGKTSPVPAPREQTLITSRVRSLSSTPVVMSAAFVDPLHTTEETEGTGIAN